MVAVVGTLLALLVFFALFGVFLTQYLPLWMEQNESQLSNGIVASLSNLKSGVDDQYLLGNIPSYSVPFTVSSANVPLFSQPTVATLAYLVGCPGGFSSSNAPVKISGCAFESTSYSTTAASGKNYLYGQTAPTNFLEVSVPSRYYPPVTYYFENDAVAGASNSLHQWMVVPSPLSINATKTGSNVTVLSSQLILVGNATSFTSVGSKDVTSRFLTHTEVSSTDRFLTKTGTPKPFNVTLTYGVYGLCGWYNYLENTTASALAGTPVTWSIAITGASGAVLPPLTSGVCALSSSTTYDLALTIKGVTFAQTFVSEDVLSFNAGGL